MPLKPYPGAYYFLDSTPSDITSGRVMNRTGGSGRLTITGSGTQTFLFFSEPLEPRTEFLNIDNSGSHTLYARVHIDHRLGVGRMSERLAGVQQNGTLVGNITRTPETTVAGDGVFILQYTIDPFIPILTGKQFRHVYRLQVELRMRITTIPFDVDVLFGTGEFTTNLIPFGDQYEQFHFQNRRYAYPERSQTMAKRSGRGLETPRFNDLVPNHRKDASDQNTDLNQYPERS